MSFKAGTLVYATIVGRRRMCIIERMEPAYPGAEEREGTENDYYWIIPIPKEGEEVQRKWVRGDKMEVISEGE
jgi:hypothetical protein